MEPISCSLQTLWTLFHPEYLKDGFSVFVESNMASCFPSSLSCPGSLRIGPRSPCKVFSLPFVPKLPDLQYKQNLLTQASKAARAYGTVRQQY